MARLVAPHFWRGLRMLKCANRSIAVRFIPHKYADGSGWLCIESTDGKVLPGCADSFFSFDLRSGMTYEHAQRLADSLNAQIERFGQTRFFAPVSDLRM
jgi:hypothetical protein